MLAVGAAPFYDPNTIEFFSSRGPTPDGRTKPEIVGIDCAASVSYEHFIRSSNGQSCWFPGTSQASPHVAGMAALVRQRFPDFTAEQTAAYLKNNAEPRGAVPNNTWGYGLAKLPTTDVGGCFHELTADGPTTGQWSPVCQSLAADRGYSQYYTFTLEEAAQVTIDLESDVDTYLFLRAGDSRSGDFLYQNDDIASGGVNLNSRISQSLAAGIYTIEATTYDTKQFGAFTLTISGLGGDGSGGGESGTPSDDCGQTITADDSPVSGTWTNDCQSMVADRGYAQYYTFTLDQQSNVTIDLMSSVDPYLYLRQGTARSGTALHENDDIASGGVNLNSRISATLSAATYTIEAATYDADETGAFTLTISGLTGDDGEDETVTEPGDMETGQCDAIPITANGTVTGTWADDCQSQVTDRGYARYYSFNLDQESAVTVTLESEVDTFLYLRQGAATSGTSLYHNDDIASGGVNLNSRITAALAAGAYTIEATTYAVDQPGSFTLTVSGLSGDDGDDETVTEPGDMETGQCDAIPVTANGTVTGTWADDCQSQVTDRGYARYYSFTLDQESAVTVTLESEVDTFLYLRSGDARSGDALYLNDDIASGGVNLNSRITATLAAGAYTIEATTYKEDETGSFTLAVSGIGGGDDSGDEEVGMDACAATTISTNGTLTGTWADDCQSMVADRGYARYYSFTMDQESAVTIELTSEVDTFLYLRSGDAQSGDALRENDDIEGGGVNLNSRVSETLAAGSYTIEATTYKEDEVGSFTMTVSGLPE